MTPVYFDSPHSDDERRRNLYGGAIYVFSPTEYGKQLCAFAADFCRERFNVADPPAAQHQIDVNDYVEILKKLKPDFIHHPECKRLIPLLLQDLGCDADQTFFDVPRIRTACAGDYLSSGMAYAFKPHRDTWYSTPMCQLNWWLPIFPIQPENGMAFHFSYWDRPIKNSSHEFNYQDWNVVGRKQAHTQGKVDKRVQSEALETLDLNGSVSLVCEPGGLILFSAAHLHSTIDNTTEETRFSLDFRTVHTGDLDGGAPNIDSESTGTTMMDYLNCRTLENFDDSVVENHRQKTPNPKFSSKQFLQTESNA